MAVAQHMMALQFGNDRRLKRAQFRRDLKAMGRVNGSHHLADVLDDPPVFLHSMTAHALLASIYKVGRLNASRWLREARVSESTTVGGLTERQTMALQRLLRRAA